MASSFENLKQWFKAQGRVHEVKSDPRGKFWVAGYLEEIHDMLKAELLRGLKKGGNDGVQKPARKRNKKA